MLKNYSFIILKKITLNDEVSDFMYNFYSQLQIIF